MWPPHSPKSSFIPPVVKNERHQRQQRGRERFYWIQDTHNSPRGGFCTVTGEKWGKKREFGEFLRGFPFTERAGGEVQIPAAALAQPGCWERGDPTRPERHSRIIPGEPRRGRGAGRQSHARLQGLSRWMSSHGSAETQGPSLLPSLDLDSLGSPGGEGDMEAGPSWREDVRAAALPEENPRLIHWTHPRWGTSPASWLQLPAEGRQCWE